MSDMALPSRETDFAEWYNQIVVRADLAEHAPVRGCMIIKPYGWTLWENMQQALDRRFKATGHVNAGFPMLIPMSFIEREASHVAGFAPELAVVTHGGGELLEEPLVVRPTSETVIGWAYSRWIQSYRDLPLLINQWCSVLRWELRPRLFIRTAEFWWQEGHTAHATQAEAEAEARRMLDVYTDFVTTEAALPVLAGRKSESERFPGADQTYTLEAMMGDRRALQAATSHNLGQNFARAFDIRYLDRANELHYCWTTSWGLSSRVIGAIVMVHGDDQGLIMPPRLAPFQVVIVPIYKNDTERGVVLAAVEQARRALAARDVRIKVDDRDGLTPGFKFNDWERRGVPLRIEIGPKDVAQGTVAVARRDQPGRAGKSAVSLAGLGQHVADELRALHTRLYERALAFQQQHTYRPPDYEAFTQAMERGWAVAWWCGQPECEAQVKEDTRATTRLIPFEQPGGEGECVRCGTRSHEVAVFGRAY